MNHGYPVGSGLGTHASAGLHRMARSYLTVGMSDRETVSSDRPEDDAAASLGAMLRSCRRAVVFTGAGISTESGIPDFRSPGGIWTKMMPIYFDEFVRSADARRESWKRRFEMESTWKTVKSNAGHLAVAQLVSRGVVI